MSDDSFDDGLVHNHSWFSAPASTGYTAAGFPIADVSNVRTPSTVHHDDQHLPG